MNRKNPLFRASLVMAIAMTIALAAAAPVNAEESCVDTFRSCSRSCLALPPSIAERRPCNSACSATFQACFKENKGNRERLMGDAVPGTSTSNEARAKFGVASITEPLTDTEVDAAGATLRAQHGDMNGTMQIVLPLEDSFRLDRERLPADPVERFLAVSNLERKYRSILTYCAFVRESPRFARGSPLKDFAARFDVKMNETIRVSKEPPEVRRAWIDGRIPASAINLTPSEQIEWEADKKTAMIQTELQRSGHRGLFSLRTDDLKLTARERSQGASFASWSEPSVNEIGLALLRVYGDQQGQSSGEFESSHSMPPVEQGPGPGADIVNRIIHLEKDGPCTKLNGGYQCNVRVWLQVFARGKAVELLRSFGQQSTTAFAAAESHNGQAGPVFVQAIDGRWQAPTLAAQSEAAFDRLFREQVAENRNKICVSYIINPSFGYLKPWYCYGRN